MSRSLLRCGLVLWMLPGFARAQVPVVRIGVVIDGPWERNDEVESRFRNEILDLTRGEFEVQFPAEAHIVGDWTVARVDAALDELLTSPDIDLVLAMGIIASDRVIRRSNLTTPVIAPFVIDAGIQDAPRAVDGAGSGVHNLSYLASSITFERNVEVFRELEDFERLVLLHGPALRAIPGVEGRLEEAATDLEIDLMLVEVSGRAEAALGRIPPDAQAVYVDPLLQLEEGELEKLASGLIGRRLPSFSVLGRSEVERGFLMSLTEDVFDRRARRVALNVQRTLLGDDPATFSVDFVHREELVINMSTARAIDVYPSFALETVAELLNDERPQTARRLNLALVAEEALSVNRDVQAFAREVAAGAENIPIARSFLLPELELVVEGAIVDRDRAEATGIAQRRLAPGLSLSQLLFSDSAWANKKIQEDLQRALVLEEQSFRLDVVQEATSTYLDVMRRLTSERIQKENLALTRSNLELAQLRVAIGTSSTSDVYRWQAQIAADQDAVIRASAQRNRAEIAVNRLLHRPLEEPFVTEETGVDDPVFLYVRELFYPYISSRQIFDVTRSALARVAIEQSPEILAIDAALAAQERKLLSSNRAFYLPDVFFGASVERQFRGGAGGNGIAELGQLFPGLELEPPNDTNWNLGVSASLPLFTSGYRPAVRRQDEELLGQLSFQRESTRERIEQRVRSSLHTVGASYAGIGLARDAAEASGNNLDLVTDAYSRGVVSILELLDAQNASVLAEEAAANAVYDFLIDMLEVERSLGKFYSRESPDEIEALFRQVDAYFADQGVAPPRRE
ncbi:MAG TPA: TolC family protein [Vicinamibacteria bacterium]|nr:TolC family protein [Vicinamibacteria bacterium]